MNLFIAFTILMPLSLFLNNQATQTSLEKRAVGDTQRTLASDLDGDLPRLPFKDWFEKVIGSDTGVVWQLSECGQKVEMTPDGTGDAQACVEVNTILGNGRRVIVMIAVGTFKKGMTGAPAFNFGVIERDGELRRIPRLRDLKALLSAPWELAKRPPIVLPELNTPGISFAANNAYLSVAALGNVEEIGWPIEIEGPPPGPPPEPPPNRPQISPPSLKQPQSIQQVVDDVLEGNAITRVEPTYPPAARLMRAFGMVRVQITVSETGAVIEAKAISGHQALRSAAVDAANKWVFKPTTVDGMPIKVQGVLMFNFRPKIQRED
jgi:TonB family protein